MKKQRAANKLSKIGDRAKARSQKTLSNTRDRMDRLKYKTKQAGAAGKSAKVERLQAKAQRVQGRASTKLNNVKTKAATKAHAVKKKYESKKK